MVYGLTWAFVWDEGFHVIAAQLIAHGKTPYLDFCFPQTPLNAYWNAAWILVFGQSWRVLHVPAALEIAGVLFLTAQYLLNHFPVPRWRAPVAIIAVCFIGLQDELVQFGPIAQAYAISMFLTLASFRVAAALPWRPQPATVVQPHRFRTILLAFASGLFAGASSASTLLTAPAALVLLAWFWLGSQGIARVKNCAAFVLGVLVPFSPVFWLFAKSPRVVFFNIVQWQALYRRSNWPGATEHDIDVLSSWLSDGQTLLLFLLGCYGIYFLWKRSHWPASSRAPLLLSAALALALTLYIATAHPTFARYFIVAIPLAAIIATVGFYAAGSRLSDVAHPFWPALILSVILVLGYGRALFEDRDSTRWSEYEQIAKKIKEVTPKNGLIFADELAYFAMKIDPPSGMEFSYSHNLELPPAEEKLYHIISQKELDAQVKAGRFATVQSCNDYNIDEMQLDKVFAHKADVSDCSIYWGWRPTPANTAPKQARK